MCSMYNVYNKYNTGAYTHDYPSGVFYCLMHKVSLSQWKTDPPMAKEVFRDKECKYDFV